MGLFEKINWDELRDQKAVLLELTEALISGGTSGNALFGLINMIDTIQDEAVEHGVLERIVFGRDFDTIENAIKESNVMIINDTSMPALVECIKGMLKRNSESAEKLLDTDSTEEISVYNLRKLDEQ